VWQIATENKESKMSNKITKHLEENGLDLDLARREVQEFDNQIAYILDAGKDYADNAIAGALVESIAIFWADLCLAGLHEVTDPYSLYSLAIEEEEVA
jgi:hypothetical protein